jgi:hypothetical protein
MNTGGTRASVEGGCDGGDPADVEDTLQNLSIVRLLCKDSQRLNLGCMGPCLMSVLGCYLFQLSQHLS